MPMALGEMLESFDEYGARIPLDRLREGLEELDLEFDDIKKYARFSESRYQRNLLHAGPGYQALILCWRNGQRSPIHDHRGSSCGVCVLKGVATETVFDHAPNGMIYPMGTRELAVGGVTGSQDDDIHQVSNLQPNGADLVTLHIYSPPLLVMGTYSLTDPKREEVLDPIFDFAFGVGI